MKKLNIHLIYFFSLLFVALLAIQSYFLYNTVLLKKDKIKLQAREILEKAAESYAFFKASDGEKNIYKVDELRKHTDLENDLRIQFKLYNDSIQKDLEKFIDSEYQRSGFKLAYKKEIISIYNGIKNKETLTKPIILFETKLAPVNNYLLYESNWETSYSTSEENRITDDEQLKNLILKHRKENFFVNLASYYDVLNMNQILFKELWSLFLVSILLMIFMLYIYYQSYKKYKAQLQQVELLHDTIDNISHEFKTPLATLLIAVKQLRIVKSDETLDLIDRQITRLENVLKPLNSNQEESKVFTRNQLIDFLNDYQVLYPKINWVLNIDVEENLPLTEFDFHSILNNLIENSLKYAGTIIKVDVLQKNDKLKIIIEDNGIGISKSNQSKIFERFYRVSTQNIHNVKGLGLGLYLVQNIVSKHQGTIQIISNLNEGCKLIIEL